MSNRDAAALRLRFEPVKGFVAGIAARVNELLRDPDRAREMGRAGRERAIERFAWPAIAEQTAALYRSTSEAALNPPPTRT